MPADFESLLATRAAAAGRMGRTGMVLAVIAETVFFAGLLFVTVAVRRTSTAWPPPGSPTLDGTLLLATSALLLGSGLTMVLGLRAIRRGSRAGLSIFVLLTALLGALFVAGQWAQFKHIGGWQTGEGQFTVLFNILSGFHALHAGIGLVLLAVLLVRTMLGQFDAERHVFVSTATTWWTFVCLIWLPILATVALG
jgi:cytochrome c oxidase subunit 3